jgi:hypothetical protein
LKCLSGAGYFSRALLRRHKTSSASQGIEAMNEKDTTVLLSNGLPQPPIPRRLLERLRDHPGHLRRLQQELNYTLDGPKPARGTTSHIFERITWTLEGCLDAFIREARAELSAAEESGDENEVANADAKFRLMLGARSGNGGMKGLDELWAYLELHQDELR